MKKKVLVVTSTRLKVNRGIEKYVKDLKRVCNINVLEAPSIKQLLAIRNKYDIIDAQDPISFVKILLTNLLTKSKKIVTLHNVYLLKGNVKRFFLRKILRFADHIICVSRNVAAPLYSHIPKSKITIITQWLDLNKYKPLKIKKIKNSYLFVGYLDEIKGFPTFIEESKKHPERKYFVAGDGPLQKLIDQNQKNLKYLGFLDEKSLIRWYNKVEYVYLPVKYSREGFNRCCMEALACGAKVIANKNVPCPRPKKGENPRKFAEKHFSEKNAKKIVEIYNRL
ncbi:MAG: glycosyltransferase family 4 protein [Candidatus Aenigmatarchaeota archaeon]